MRQLLEEPFTAHKFDICYHLGASINVQDSIDDPRTTFNNDTIGTFNVMEQCRKHNVKVVFMSTCMVYDRCTDETGITEQHPIKTSIPLRGSKDCCREYGSILLLCVWACQLSSYVHLTPMALSRKQAVKAE